MERDPLIKRGNAVLKNAELYGKDDDQGGSSMQGALLFIVPFLIFIGSLLVIHDHFHSDTVKCAVVLGIFVLCGCWFAFAGGGRKRWLARLSFLTFLAILEGVIVGLVIYYKYMIYYHAYNDMRTYTNVAASQPSGQFEDAGMLLFTSDTQVDVNRAVGYRDAATATTICVAPVVDSSMGPTDPISFWAVGTNCCEPRAHFACDGATKGGARAALLKLDSDVLVSPTVELIASWFGGLGWHDASKYDDAIRLDEAAYSSVPADHKRFLRWTDDPHKLAAVYKDDGTTAVVHAIIIMFVASIVLAIAMAPAKRKPAESTG